MVAITIPNPIKNILIIGNCAGKTDKLIRAQTLISNYDLTVLLGGVYYKWQKRQEVEQNIDLVEECIATGKFCYCVSDDDLMLTEGLLEEMSSRMISFYEKTSHLVEASFSNGNKIIATNGGITPTMSRAKLDKDIECVFVHQVNKKAWHELYDGRLGYVVSNLPSSENEPQFYNYSARIGTTNSDKVYAQEADQFGLKRTIVL